MMVRWISIIFHPFVMVGVMVGAAAAVRQGTGGAVRAATGLALMRSPVGYALLVALPVLMWSRLTLERHSPVEVALGTVIGAAAGAALHYL